MSRVCPACGDAPRCCARWAFARRARLSAAPGSASCPADPSVPRRSSPRLSHAFLRGDFARFAAWSWLWPRLGWRAEGAPLIQQSYRFLRAVMNTAVRDGAINRNPCNIPGAGTDRAKERPVATPAQVASLIEAITPRYRAAVLLAAWCGLRRGEVLGLLPQDVDLDAGTITVRRNRIELLETRQAFDADPKTDAGRRTVSIPPHVLPFLIEHMTTWAGTDRVFIGRDGRPMRGDAIRQAFTRARHTADMPGFRFHDLRHTGQTLAASTGATTKDLMLRLGHASPAAANRYLHTVDGRDAEIASALSDLAAHGNAARLPKAIVIKS